MKKIISWVIPSFEGHDGKASFRRLSAFGLLALILYNGVMGMVVTTMALYALIVYATTFLLLVGIITADTLTTIIRDKASFTQKTTETETVTNVEVQKVEVKNVG